MRDKGFNFFGHDEYCANIFSKPFEPVPGTKAAAICAFEVLEHVMNPIEFLAGQMKKYQTETVIASTTVFEGKMPDFTWPYYSFESGQHVTIYQPRSLQLIARALDCRYFRLMEDLHLITKHNLAPWKLFVLRNKLKLNALKTRFARRNRSYTLSDYESLRNRIATQGPAGLPHE